MNDHPIGIFDSGIGGLTVLKELQALLPQERLVYLGDTARVPYGTKSPETVCRYAVEAAAFLVNRGVKMLVVACNTASAVALPQLRERFRIPVVGVLGPGARAAVRHSRKGVIGVIGTEGTVRSGAYSRAILELAPSARVFAAACPLFVPLAEEGWARHRVAHLAAEEYLEPLRAEGMDTLVLGCTHYPLLKETLGEVLGPEVALIDSAQETALCVRQELRRCSLLRRGETLAGEFFVTDTPTRFERVGGAFLGQSLERVRQVDLDTLFG